MISQTAEYALRAVVFLASNGDLPTSRNAIAEATHVPHDYLTKVLRELDRAGVLSSQRGPGGGYVLAAPPDETSVYEIVCVVAPVQRVEKCPLGLVVHKQLCPLHQRLDEAAEFVEQTFRDTMISDLVPSRVRKSRCGFPHLD